MLSRLKRKPPSASSSTPDSPSSLQLDHDDDPAPPSASSPTSTRSTPQQHRSYTTPVKGTRTQTHLSTDSLSPTRHRAYTAAAQAASPDDHGLLRRPTSRASSFGSAHHDRPSFDSTHAIGQGSLSLHHLAPPPSHPSSSSSSSAAPGPGLTLVVQAPELVAHSSASRDGHDTGYDYHLHPDADADDHSETPTSYSGDHRTPLAAHEPLYDPHQPDLGTLNSSTHSQPVPDTASSSSLSPQRARPRSHTSSEAVFRTGAPLAASTTPHPRAARASASASDANGLDALEAINRGPPSRSGGARSGSGSGTGPGTGTGSGTASPPSMSRASSRGAGPALGSRPVSRSNSINSQQHPHAQAHSGEPHLATAAATLRPGSASGGARSYSPARGRKPGSGSSNGAGPSAKGGIAGALALSGVSLATPGGARPPGVALGAGLMAAAAAAAAAGEGERNMPASPGAGAGAAAGSPTHAAPQHASARTSLESHIAAAAGVPYQASGGGGGGAGDESDGAGSSPIYLGHHGGDHASAFLSMDHLGDYDDVVSQLGTGYAVASSKRNADFHALFKNVPDDDYLIEGASSPSLSQCKVVYESAAADGLFPADYGCALQREILIQGRLYISEHHLSFYANIFGWVTSVRRSRPCCRRPHRCR